MGTVLINSTNMPDGDTAEMSFLIIVHSRRCVYIQPVTKCQAVIFMTIKDVRYKYTKYTVPPQTELLLHQSDTQWSRRNALPSF